MKRLPVFMASLLLLSAPSFGQKVKLAKVALGMSETEVKDALGSSSPHYIDQPSANPELHLLIAETADESFGFTFIDGHVAAFSLMHVLPAGQQPFLKPGQEPSVKVLRNLVIAQTWKPAKIETGDTFWASDASGAALSDFSQCAPKSSPAWTSIGDIPETAAKTTVGLMKPSLVLYSQSCGVTIHLNEAPAKTEDDRVDAVRIQVLDVRALNQFVLKHPQR